MPRPPRIDIPDALYHVTSRGSGRASIFSTNDDRRRFLGQLAHVDPAGNLVPMVSADGTDNYTLDNSNQLQSASLTSEGYSYSENGNRQTANGSTYTTGTDNRLLSDGVYDYQYDAEGNRIARWQPATPGTPESQPGAGDTDITLYQWDYRNRLTSETSYANYANYQGGASSQAVSYAYDCFGALIRRGLDDDGSAGPHATSYVYTVYDGSSAYLQVSDANHLANGGATAVVSQRYLYGPAVDQVLATDNCSGTGAGVLWGLGDHEGTVRDVVNGSGVVQNHVQYDSFGKPLNALAANFLFGQAGIRFDPATGEYRTANRVYDPRTGRPLSQDPLGLAPDSNPYRWCNNNLAVNSDPSGLWITGATVYKPPSSYDFSVSGILANTPIDFRLPGNGSNMGTIGSFGSIPGWADLYSTIDETGYSPRPGLSLLAGGTGGDAAAVPAGNGTMQTVGSIGKTGLTNVPEFQTPEQKRQEANDVARKQYEGDVGKIQQWLDQHPNARYGRPSDGSSWSSPNYADTHDTTDLTMTLDRSWAQAIGDATTAVVTGESTNPKSNLDDQPEQPEGGRDIPMINRNNRDISVDKYELNDTAASRVAAINAGAAAANELLNGMSQIQVICKRTGADTPYIVIIANPGLVVQRPLSPDEVGTVTSKWLNRGLKKQ